jgi:hypothetical protein
MKIINTFILFFNLVFRLEKINKLKHIFIKLLMQILMIYKNFHLYKNHFILSQQIKVKELLISIIKMVK